MVLAATLRNSNVNLRPNTTMLTIRNLSISFAGQPAVNRLSFNLEKGKTLAIVGESGSGKSLTALAIMGLLPPGAQQNGALFLSLKDRQIALHELDEKEWQQLRGAKIGMVFQEPMSALNPVMTVGAQIAESLQLHQKINSRQAKTTAIQWLQKVQLPAPEKTYDKYPHQLSGGQKQRVMIAMALCCEPLLLLADEPTTALDATIQKEVLLLMKELQQEMGTATVFITHDLAVARYMADDILVMLQGKAVEQGPATAVLQHPQALYTRALLACRPSPEQKGKALPTIASFMEGGSQESQAAFPINPAPSAEVLLKARNISVWYEAPKRLGRSAEAYHAVQDVSFDLYKGEVLGLVGESGCGKSTLGRSLMGLQPIKEGRLIFGGRDLSHLSEKEWRHVRREIQLVFQDPFAALNPRMTVGDTLTEPMRVVLGKKGREARKEARRLMDLVNLPESALQRYPHQFSGGQRQRINIARALALQPELLICDESVSALDISIQAQILNLLQELQRGLGLTLLFISHDLSVVYYLAHRVLVMQAGRLVAAGSAAEILLHPGDAYTRKLVAAAGI